MSRSTSKYVPALGYDFLTPFYDKVVALTTREAAFKSALVDQSNLEPSARVLDLACGTGTLTIMMKESMADADVTGIDGDDRILKIAGSKASAKQLNIRFDQGMSYNLPYDDNVFDRVVSSLFFHHLTRRDKIKSLNEARRVLKHGGELHIADWGTPSNIIMSVASYSIKVLDGFETTRDNFNGSLPNLIEESGFSLVEETRAFDTIFGTIRLYKTKKMNGGSNET